MTTIDYKVYPRGYPLDDGKVIFYDANGDFLKKRLFKDAAIVHYEVTFNANSEDGMIAKMLISPAIQEYGSKVVRNWHVSAIEEEVYQSPVYVSEQEELKNVRHFKLKKNGEIIYVKGIKRDYDILINEKNEEIQIPVFEIMDSLKKFKFSVKKKYLRYTNNNGSKSFRN